MRVKSNTKPQQEFCFLQAIFSPVVNNLMDYCCILTAYKINGNILEQIAKVLLWVWKPPKFAGQASMCYQSIFFHPFFLSYCYFQFSLNEIKHYFVICLLKTWCLNPFTLWNFWNDFIMTDRNNFQTRTLTSHQNQKNQFHIHQVFLNPHTFLFSSTTSACNKH